jgi:hypothetical protein
VRRAADRVRSVQRQATSKGAAAGDAARATGRRSADGVRTTTTAATKQRSSARREAPARASADPAPTCLPIQMPQLLAALDLGSLLSLLCTTIDLPARSGGPSPAVNGAVRGDAGLSPVGTVARVLGAVASIASPTNPLALLAPDQIRLLDERVAGDESGAGRNANGVSVAGAVAGGASHPRTAGAHAAGPEPAGYTGGSGVPTATHDPVQGHSDGVLGDINATNALMTILMIDLALLAAILMWRAARRWVVPRLA